MFRLDVEQFRCWFQLCMVGLIAVMFRLDMIDRRSQQVVEQWLHRLRLLELMRLEVVMRLGVVRDLEEELKLELELVPKLESNQPNLETIHLQRHLDKRTLQLVGHHFDCKFLVRVQMMTLQHLLKCLARRVSLTVVIDMNMATLVHRMLSKMAISTNGLIME